MVGMPRPIQGVAASSPAPALSFVPRSAAPSAPAPRIATDSSTPFREIYSAGNRELPMGMLGKLVRSEGNAPSGDVAVDQAYDNAGIVYNFFKQVLGRNSLDDRGMKLKSTVHFGTDYNNAYWNGESMTYGDGDGKRFAPLTGALDVVGHEMSHAVTERTAGLQYSFQSGALNESWSDVFGEIIEQWHENPRTFGTPSGAKAADWLIGEDVFTPNVSGDGLRSMKNPGTGYAGDPQPGHMRDYKRMSRFQDHGGVHYNSGIPNRAAYEAAVRIGSEKVAQIWYRALTDYLRPSAQFTDAAQATIRAASELFTSEPSVAQAVTDAWTAVGVIGPDAIKVPVPVSAPDAGTGDRHRHLAATEMAARRNPGIVPPWLTPPAR